jgi:hypothetical protein
MPPLIRAYNVATGVENSEAQGYHHSITLASLAAARAALAAAPEQPLTRVLNDLLAGPQGRPDWLLRHLSHARLFSPQARRAWCAPDLLPLPFA